MQEIVYHTNYELEDNYFWFISRAKIVRNIIEKKTNLKQGDEVLDIGSGTGGFAEILSKDFKVACMDTEPIALEYCKKRGLDDVNLGILSDLDTSGRNIKAAVMLDVIEHIEDDKGVVKDVYDLLPEGGYFIATVPAYQWMWSHHDVMHMHYRRYNLDNFSKLLTNAGFTIKYRSYFNSFLFPLVYLKRAIDNITNNEKEEAVETVPKFLNWLFEKIFSAERFFLPAISFPFGLSIIVVAQKKSKK